MSYLANVCMYSLNIHKLGLAANLAVRLILLWLVFTKSNEKGNKGQSDQARHVKNKGLPLEKTDKKGEVRSLTSHFFLPSFSLERAQAISGHKTE